MQKVWFITGVSKGMGLSLVLQLIANGQFVAGTSRDPSNLSVIPGAEDRFLPLQVDLKSDVSVSAAIQKTVERFGRVDVIVNNAGYGLGGALEEFTMEEITENFEVNFFAAVRVIKAALPFLRKQQSGHIINISSIAGFAPGTGWSMYSAAKFALSGLSQALYNDLKPLGIAVTNVLPGWFRTNFAKADSIVYSRQQIEDYRYLRASHERMSQLDGAQPGDPDKVAAVFMQLVERKEPPADLFLGSDALQRGLAKTEQLQASMQEWRELSVSTDF